MKRKGGNNIFFVVFCGLKSNLCKSFIMVLNIWFIIYEIGYCWVTINEYVFKVSNLFSFGVLDLKELLININLEYERSWLWVYIFILSKVFFFYIY